MLDVVKSKSMVKSREFDSWRAVLSIIVRETWNLVFHEPYIFISILGSVVTLVVRLSVEFLVPLSVYS